MYSLDYIRKIVNEYIDNYHRFDDEIFNRFRKINDKKIKSNVNFECSTKNDFSFSLGKCTKNIYVVNSLKEYLIFLNHILSSYNIVKKKENKKNIVYEKYRKKYIFRGIDNLILMKSKLFQNLVCKGIIDIDMGLDARTFKDISNKIFERELLAIKKFEENASLRLEGFNTVNELIANAKHYELETRFVDWSYSPLITTLFAVSDDAKIELVNSQNEIIGKYYCLMLREYNDNTLIIKDLPYDLKNAFNGIDLEKLSEDTKKILNDFKTKINSSLTYSQPNYFYCKYKQAMTIYNSLYYLVLNLDEDKRKFFNGTAFRQKMKEDFFGVLSRNNFTIDEQAIIHVVYNYFETVYDLTNSSFDKNSRRESVVLMTRKFLAFGSKILLETAICNDRLRNQRGIFEIDTYESYQDVLANDSNIFLLIDSNAKKEIIKYINTLGFNYYMLMDEPYKCSKVIKDTMDGKYSFDEKIEYLVKSKEREK